jgi:hypothetical protein
MTGSFSIWQKESVIFAWPATFPVLAVNSFAVRNFISFIFALQSCFRRSRSMMFFLMRDVLRNLTHVPTTHRKRGVGWAPFKVA